MFPRVLSILLVIQLSIFSLAAEKAPVIIGFDGEFGHQTSTSAESIKNGILTAIHEINKRGGVLDGRKLELQTKDNRSVPARGVQNLKEFAEVKDLVAVIGGKFSPVVLETVPAAHESKMILFSAWAAADGVTENNYTPNYAFRLSLKDSWAMPHLIKHAKKRGFKKVGFLFPLTAWGRGSDTVATKFLEKYKDVTSVGKEWYAWGDKSLIEKYENLKSKGAQTIILVANEGEGSILVNEIASLPKNKRLPILSHWGVSGGNFTFLSKDNLKKVDFEVIQTFSFFDNPSPKAKEIVELSKELFNYKGPEDILAPVGFAHAYDLTHILALAIDQAKSVDRAKIRDQLENLQKNYAGLIKNYKKPFSKTNHEALHPDLLFMARFQTDGTIRKSDGKIPPLAE